MITSDFDQIFEDMSAPEYPATCDGCGEVGTNASMAEHQCLTKEEADLVAGAIPLQALPSGVSLTRSQIGWQSERLPIHGCRVVDNTGRLIAADIYNEEIAEQIVTEHNQHATLIAERNRLREERKRLLATLRQSRNAAQVFIDAQYLDTARQGLTQIVSDIDEALATEETEEEG